MMFLGSLVSVFHFIYLCDGAGSLGENFVKNIYLCNVRESVPNDYYNSSLYNCVKLQEVIVCH